MGSCDRAPEDVDSIALLQRDDCPLRIGALAESGLRPNSLSGAVAGVNTSHLHLECLFDCNLDLRQTFFE